jgi:thioredoxin-related protein
MNTKEVIEIQAEDYIEEQLLVEAFPEAVWFTGVGNTRFYLPTYMKEEVNQKMEEWEEKSLS